MHVRSRAAVVAVVCLFLLALSPNVRAADGPTKLLRFPDVHGDRVVFTYAGDLWLASTEGGLARRLTAHPGQELFARFSPDGRWIAFTGQYDGDEQVYVMPAEGGEPRQLTFYPARGPLPPRWGYDNQVYGWTPDGEAILFRSLRDSWDLSDSKLYTISPDGGLPRALPMPTSGAGALSPDGARIVYSPLFRDFRSWKRYEGGWAQDLWIFDLQARTARNITDHPRTDRDPMWIGEKIYFTSDRDGTLNLYAYDPAGGALEQLTHSRTWDVRWPSDDGSHQIVYELGGELQLLDLNSGDTRALRITVPYDGLAARPGFIDVREQIESTALGPQGKRALFVARGDLFTVPAEKGVTRNLTRSSGAHDRAAAWSPDGRWIAYISDRDGDDALWLIAQDGKKQPRKLAELGQAMLYTPVWAPGSDKVALQDKDGRIFVVRIDDGSVTEVVRDPGGAGNDFSWSPHGGHLALSLAQPNGFRSVFVWSEADGELRRVTSELFNSFSPVWGTKGEYLYLLSDREFAPQIGSLEWNYVVDRETYIYALALRADVPHPFPPESDEVPVKEGEDAGGGAAGAKTAGDSAGAGAQAESAPIQIDFDGLGERIARVPVEADNYSGIGATDGYLLYMRGAPFYYGRGADVRPALKIFSLKERKESTLLEGVSGVVSSPDGSKLLVRQGREYKIIDARPGGAADAKVVSTAGLRVYRDPHAEWEQIFNEVWRRFRDFFYVPNMHGYDWDSLRAQYAPLLRYVAHRSDLNYVISEMIAELSVSHAYITGGDFEIPERPPVGLPGARFELDERAGRYRISHIFEGDNAEDRYRSPLREIGVDARVGDYLLAIDGEELTAADNPYARLRYRADRPVTLTLSASADGSDAREVTYRPIRSETKLIYLEWVLGNRRRVEQLGGGRIGYLHVPDMGADGIREFIKWFYGQVRKDALIIDVRGNGGGNVSQMLINRLDRKLLSLTYPRTSQIPSTYPSVVFTGPMVCLLNENSASDGDIFPRSFREAGLGPLIGKRSWGGVIGITSHGPLIDGGGVNVPEFGYADAEGRWIVENHGVDPDIEVDNDPISLLQGRDPQLERGVQELLRALEGRRTGLPPRPAPPVKTRR